MPTARRRPLTLLLLLLAACAALAVVLAVRGGGEGERDASACPPGYLTREEQETIEQKEGPLVGESGEEEEEGEKLPACAPRMRPESLREVLTAKGLAEGRDAAPYEAVNPRAYARAARQRDRLAEQGSTIPGGGETWQPYGKGPLIAGEEGFENSQFGFRKLNGRVSDFASGGGKRVFASVGSGGLWESDDLGGSWRSIGDGLPVQSVGSVGYTKRENGEEVIIALTGDNAFGGNTYAGVGAYWSTDDGKTWTRSDGLPDGALGFKVEVDPTKPDVVYAATGLGLYRSANAGRTFTNAKLPTSEECQGDETGGKDCFFANVVTDVVVQAPDKFDHTGGKVMAAVGWRAGTEPNYAGKPQAPGNGIYVSEDGVKPFEKLGFNGLVPADADPETTEQDSIGRIELGIANGPEQNHEYVYATVQDAVLFNKRKKAGIDVGEDVDPADVGADPTNKNTVLNGIYVSSDFGASWRLLSSGYELQTTPGNNSALVGVYSALGVAPGIQSWYDQWIQPNPSTQVGGVPTLLSFGLEEVWQNQPTGLPLDGHASFKVVGRYFSGDTCQGGLLPTLPPDKVCPTSNPPIQGYTTHPDQHAGMYVLDQPNPGDVTLLEGNDGGAYVQTKPAGTGLDNDSWGEGANEGFYTLIPYEANMAKDGTVYGGLQDNGGLKIQPDGKQLNWQGGDGFFAAVDPDNPDVAYGEVTGGYMYRTVDGGKTSEFIDPALTSGAFATPFKMDPTDAKHLIIAGRDVKETTFGPDTTIADGADWQKVYDLGTLEKPGDADAKPTPDDPDTQKNENSNNINTAIDLHGDAAYVGYCAYCDPLTTATPFRSGIATNVGGDKAPKRMTGDGWHIAEANGLPERYITGVRFDPANPSTVYVTLAGYYVRPYAPLGALGEDLTGTEGGHVYKSTDAGRNFTDITGNLPDVPATDIEFAPGGRLALGTNVGMFISETAEGGRWEVLGKGLPTAPVYSLSLKPDDPNLLIAATYGRGVQVYRFPPGSDRPVPGRDNNGPGGGGDGKTPGGTPPGGTPPGGDGLAGCTPSGGIKTVNVRSAGGGKASLAFTRRTNAPVTVDVFRVSTGRRVIRERLVARFRNRTGSVRWNGKTNVSGGRKKVGDGYYFVRYVMRDDGHKIDARRLVLRRKHGRFTKRPDFFRRDRCDLLRRFKLERPVFGGPRKVTLKGAYQLSADAKVTITISRGSKVVRRYKAVSREAERTYRFTLPAKRRAKGDYRVRVRAVSAATRVTATLTSRRL
ncbi:MAG TPA: hypothetical protein VF533_02270 [Solirubrobacteraceae bacterium]|jgi:hypothetical protein